ncbi:gas vesicle protein [Streptomyces sp. CA2R106]|uniref:gas vesicle protein n=1 Tax=Streptomyces sp. CA2R106 TaxID=3120153 RepID=UPI00300A5754
MSDSLAGRLGSPATASPYGQSPSTANLADILERVLDKGVVIAGDIQINLLDIELLTIKLRLLVASVDKAKEMGIDWWEHDPSLSSGAGRRDAGAEADRGAPPSSRASHRDPLAAENDRLRAEIARLRETSAIAADGAPRPADLEEGER